MPQGQWRPAYRIELIKAIGFDVLVLVAMSYGPQLLFAGFGALAGDNPFLGLGFAFLMLFAVCAFAGWWFGTLLKNDFQSFGYRRQNLHRVYGDSEEVTHVGLGGAMLQVLLSPIDFVFLIFKVNASRLFFWARNVQVIYVPPGHPLPKGPLPRRWATGNENFPVEFNQE